MNVVSVVNAALANAHKTPDIGETPGKIHRNRSSVFAEALAREFRSPTPARAQRAAL